MRAVAVFPGKPDSLHLADLPEPDVDDLPDRRGVLVEVLRVGVNGTDKEKECDQGVRRGGQPLKGAQTGDEPVWNSFWHDVSAKVS